MSLGRFSDDLSFLLPSLQLLKSALRGCLRAGMLPCWNDRALLMLNLFARVQCKDSVLIQHVGIISKSLPAEKHYTEFGTKTEWLPLLGNSDISLNFVSSFVNVFSWNEKCTVNRTLGCLFDCFCALDYWTELSFKDKPLNNFFWLAQSRISYNYLWFCFILL